MVNLVASPTVRVTPGLIFGFPRVFALRIIDFGGPANRIYAHSFQHPRGAGKGPFPPTTREENAILTRALTTAFSLCVPS